MGDEERGASPVSNTTTTKTTTTKKKKITFDLVLYGLSEGSDNSTSTSTTTIPSSKIAGVGLAGETGLCVYLKKGKKLVLQVESHEQVVFWMQALHSRC